MKSLILTFCLLSIGCGAQDECTRTISLSIMVGDTSGPELPHFIDLDKEGLVIMSCRGVTDSYSMYLDGGKAAVEIWVSRRGLWSRLTSIKETTAVINLGRMDHRRLSKGDLVGVKVWSNGVRIVSLSLVVRPPTAPSR